MMFSQVSVIISDASQIGEARRETARLALNAGLNEADRGKAAIIATELATNLSRYALGGVMLLRSYTMADAAGVEILAIDSGPGMANVPRCLQDGYSTGGTPGNGLGAVARLASVFDIYSAHEQGTVILARLQIAAPGQVGFAWGVVNLPVAREVISGDTWRIDFRQQLLSILVVDGLGHGPLAEKAARAAAETFEIDPFAAPEELIARADRNTRGTRGAAVAVAHMDGAAGQLKFVGVGNISGGFHRRPPERGRSFVSQNGTLGVGTIKIRSFDYETPRDAVMVFHSDGLKNRWSLESYPGLLDRHPATIAGVLYRDFHRDNDDVTVCVVRSLSG